MTPRERFQLMLDGGLPDRVAWALWRHYPHADFTPAFVTTHVDDMQRGGYDLWKISLPSAYSVKDYGVIAEYRGDAYGRPEFINKVVTTTDHWMKLKPLDPLQGYLGMAVADTAAISKMAPPEVPVLLTVFSPVTQAARLCGGLAVLVQHLQQEPEKVLFGLAVLAESTRRFLAALEGGRIDGLFYAVQECGLSTLSPWRDYFKELDQELLLREGYWLNLLHLHGNIDDFAHYARYPVSILHWDTRESQISLLNGAGIFGGIVSGGLEVSSEGRSSWTPDVEAEMETLVNLGRCMFAAGCVIPWATHADDIARSRSLCIPSGR